MTRPKRKLNTESSSGSFWPWVVGVAIVLVLLVGIGLGVALSGGNGKVARAAEGAGGSPPGGGGDIAAVLKGTGNGGNGNDGKGKTGPTKVNPVDPPPLANPKIFEFIGKNQVYLVPTTAGRYEMTALENRSDLLGDFFKALKAHDTKHGTFSTDKNPPTEFSPATYAIGPDPISLKASKGIKYNAQGGTLADLFHYHLGQMTIVMHTQNPAKKNKGIAFHFPGFKTWGQAKRPWIHVAGETGSGIKPFYLVPLETTQPTVALINLKVGGGIQFDDATMTAKADPKIESAMKKLLKDNGLPQSIKFWAGAPLAKWGSAHLAGKDTINFKVVIAEKKAAAVFGSNNVEAGKTNIKAAIDKLFPAAEAALTAQKEMDKARIEVGEAFKNKQALLGAGNQHQASVAKVFAKYGINNAAQLSQLFGRRIQSFADLTEKDFENKNFTSKFSGTIQVSASEQEYQHIVIRQQCKKFLDARKKYTDAVKTWQEKAVTFNQKATALTQKNNEFVNAINQLKASRVPPDAISDAGQIRLGRMTLDAAKTKWQNELNKAESTNWSAEIAKWDDPNHKKAEWNKFKGHDTFYLGTPSGTLIRFSK